MDCRQPDQEEGSERRIFERFAVQLVMAGARGSSRFECFTENVSLTGARLSYRGPLAIGDRIELSIEVPGADAASVDAEVRWIAAGPRTCGVVFRGASRAPFAAFLVGWLGLPISSGRVQSSLGIERSQRDPPIVCGQPRPLELTRSIEHLDMGETAANADRLSATIDGGRRLCRFDSSPAPVVSRGDFEQGAYVLEDD